MRPTPVATPGTLTPGLPAGRIGSGVGRARDWCIAGVLASHTFDVVLAVGVSGAALPQAFEGHSVVTIPADAAQFPAVDGTPLIYVTATVEAPALRDLLEACDGSDADRSRGAPHRGCRRAGARAVIDEVHLEAWSKVIGIDLDLLPARLLSEPEDRYRLRGGLGVVETDASRAVPGTDPRTHGTYPSVHVMRRGRDALAALDNGPSDLPAVREDLQEEHLRALRATIDPLQLRTEAELRHLEREHRRLLAQYLVVVKSSSWRLTARCGP